MTLHKLPEAKGMMAGSYINTTYGSRLRDGTPHIGDVNASREAIAKLMEETESRHLNWINNLSLIERDYWTNALIFCTEQNASKTWTISGYNNEFQRKVRETEFTVNSNLNYNVEDAVVYCCLNTGNNPKRKSHLTQ